MLHRLSSGAVALALISMSAGCATGVEVPGSGGASSSAATMAGAGGADASPPGSCTVAADCVAMNDTCNVGTCVNGTCVKGPANELSPCDDGLFCTDNDVCMSGVCVGGGPKFCPTDDTCHIGACDEQAKKCTTMAGNDGAQCDDMDNCTLAGTCSAGTCLKGSPVDCSVFDGTCAVGVCDPLTGCKPMAVNDGTPCDDGFFCTVNDQCTAGQCTGAPNTCAPPGGCYVGMCDMLTDTCVAVPGNDGQPCDDGNSCTKNTTCLNGACTNGLPDNEGAMCDDGSSCTSMTTCTSGVCGGGIGPTVYFADDFHDGSKGWILGQEWQIGPAMASSGEDTGFPDPGTDHTLTADNGVAGVEIGGNAIVDPANPVHPMYYLESPPFDTQGAQGPVIFGYYRWLNSDVDPWMTNNIDVWDGSQWVNLWTSDGLDIVDSSWTYDQYDITAYKNPAMKIRFGFSIGDIGVFVMSSWNIDDVLVASAACP